MREIQVVSEAECRRGWTYQVRIKGTSGSFSDHAVRLDWSEHELWCGGRCPPSRVVEVLLGALLEHDPQRQLPAKFDAATIRRWWPAVDELLPARL